MLKIKKIEFLKAIYDESLSHNIFSIANITFSNYAPVNGALLYWQKNTSEEPFTEEGDYKFYYDMAQSQYFAAVKFPKDCKLTRDQRQELAYLLLEERGTIGTYSFVTTKPKKNFHLKQALQQITFPEHFNVQDFNTFACFSQFEEPSEDFYANSHYDRAFLLEYLRWCKEAVKEHPAKLDQYFDYIPFGYVCYGNPLLSEQFLIDYLNEVDLYALQYNKTVLARLSTSFKRYMIKTLKSNNKPIHSDFSDQLEDFIESDVFYSSYDVIYLPESDEHCDMDLQFFEYDRGTNKWPGSEHLVKGIPSLMCQKYDRYGDKRPTNAEMDKKFATYNKEQQKLFAANVELHWINRYRNELDWSIVCQYNEMLTEAFLSAHMKYIDFTALGLNTFIELDTSFLSKHINRFDHGKPVPLIICHLTEQFYLTHKDHIKVDIDLLYKYMDCIDEQDFDRIESYLID